MARVPGQLYVEDQKGRGTNCATFLKLWGRERRQRSKMNSGRRAEGTTIGEKGEKSEKKEILFARWGRDFLLDATYLSLLPFFPPSCHFLLHSRIAGNFMLVLFAYTNAVAVLCSASHQVYLYGSLYPMRDQRLEIEGDKESVRRFGKETEVC